MKPYNAYISCHKVVEFFMKWGQSELADRINRGDFRRRQLRQSISRVLMVYVPTDHSTFNVIFCVDMVNTEGRVKQYARRIINQLAAICFYYHYRAEFSTGTTMVASKGNVVDNKRSNKFQVFFVPIRNQ